MTATNGTYQGECMGYVGVEYCKEYCIYSATNGTYQGERMGYVGVEYIL